MIENPSAAPTCTTSDEPDAFALAEKLRLGALDKRVFKNLGPYRKLRELGRAHFMVVRDVVRTQNRVKSLIRSRGVAVEGKTVYRAEERPEYVDQLPEGTRAAALTLFAQYDALQEIRKRAEKELLAEARLHPITKQLATCPRNRANPRRVARAHRGHAASVPDQAAVLVVLRARHRYALVVGLGARQGGKLAAGQGATNPWFECQSQPPAQSHLQGRCHHRPDPLHDDPLYQDYQRLLAGGTKPNLAKVTVARKVAAIVLSMWKAEEVYDPAKHRKPISQ